MLRYRLIQTIVYHPWWGLGLVTKTIVATLTLAPGTLRDDVEGARDVMLAERGCTGVRLEVDTIDPAMDGGVTR